MTCVSMAFHLLQSFYYHNFVSYAPFIVITCRHRFLVTRFAIWPYMRCIFLPLPNVWESIETELNSKVIINYTLSKFNRLSHIPCRFCSSHTYSFRSLFLFIKVASKCKLLKVISGIMNVTKVRKQFKLNLFYWYTSYVSLIQNTNGYRDIVLLQLDILRFIYIFVQLA